MTFLSFVKRKRILFYQHALIDDIIILTIIGYYIMHVTVSYAYRGMILLLHPTFELQFLIVHACSVKDHNKDYSYYWSIHIVNLKSPVA